MNMNRRRFTFLFLSWLVLWTGAPRLAEPAQGATSARALKDQLLALKTRGFSEESLALYLNQVILAEPLTAEDMADCKKSGVPETVLQAAMRRARAHFISVPIEAKLIPLDLTIDPMVFHSVQVQLRPRKDGRVTVTFVVKASNPGDRDYDGVVKATLLSAEGSPLISETKRREIEEGEKNKDIKVELEVRESVLTPKVTCKLEFSVS